MLRSIVQYDRMNRGYECKHCGFVSERWSARCPECQTWITSTLQGRHADLASRRGPRVTTPQGDVPAASSLAPGAAPQAYHAQSAPGTAPPASIALLSNGSPGPIPITDVTEEDIERVLTGIEPLDRVLGGGLVPGCVVLLGGDPGIGKSTLLSQMMATVPCARLLYATGEETIPQAATRARRIGAAKSHIQIVAETDVDRVAGHARAVCAQILVVDSIQTLRATSLPSAPGSDAQVRECTGRLMRFAKDTSTTTILVGHITKDGNLAGPETLQHLVDVILQFELDPEFPAIRVLRCIIKNRFGDTTETGSFEMTPIGLRPIVPGDVPPRGDRDSDAMTPIAQELVYRLLELGGVLDPGIRDRIGDRLDLVPRSSP